MQYRYNLRDAETSAAGTGQTGSAAAATYAQRTAATSRVAEIWLCINTYENTIFSGMNIHKSQLF
jgi:hypothetical protein